MPHCWTLTYLTLLGVVRGGAAESIIQSTSPTAKPIINPFAIYDPEFGAPRCREIGRSCNAVQSLLKGVGDSETNSPNTIDGCKDTSIGIYVEDESIEQLLISTVSRKTLAVGEEVDLTAWVYTAANTSKRDEPDEYDVGVFFYTPDAYSASNDTWNFISYFMVNPGQGLGYVKTNFTLMSGRSTQAVRLTYGYAEYAIHPCYNRKPWHDIDDLVFEVDHETYPSTHPSASIEPTDSSGPTELMSACNIKKIKIQSTTDLAINMFELGAFYNGSNVPLGNAANQSSTFNEDNTKFGAYNAVDNDTTTFSSTNDAPGQWWQIILENSTDIHSIQILNRYCGQDTSDPLGCLCRFTNAEIILYNENMSIMTTRLLGNTCGMLLIVELFACPNTLSPTEPTTQQTINPSPPSMLPASQYPSFQPVETFTERPTYPISKGNITLSPVDSTKSSSCGVKRIKIQSMTTQPINIFEFKVIFNGVNVAVEGNATQSNTFRNDEERFGANNAVDGDEATFSSTAEQNDQWWQIELRRSSDIHSIEIVNRYCGLDPTDPLGCLCRLSGVELVLFSEVGSILDTRELGDTCGLFVITMNFTCYRTTGPSFSPSFLIGSPISMADTGHPTPISYASTSSPIIQMMTATYDSTLKVPKCSEMSAGCSSGSFLVGSGSFSSPYLESNAPNTIDGCKGDETLVNIGSIYKQDESIEVIIVTSVDEGVFQVGHDVKVNVTVWSAQSVSNRTDPHKSSIAHIYYALDIQNIAWKHVHSEIVETSKGEHTFDVSFALESDFSVSPDSTPLTILQAVRVSYGYAQYRSNPCPENDGYTDVDDLVFAVSLLPSTASPTKSPTSSAYSHVQNAWSAFFVLCCFIPVLALCSKM